MKANIFNNYFANQCTILNNGSVLPELVYKTQNSLDQIFITQDQIVDIIHKYSLNKAHGCDELSVTMLQLCAKEISIPLSLIFRKCISTGTFPDS